MCLRYHYILDIIRCVSTQRSVLEYTIIELLGCINEVHDVEVPPLPESDVTKDTPSACG
jgi:hypothetical protein